MVARTVMRPRVKRERRSGIVRAECAGEDQADRQDDDPDLARGEADGGHAGALR